MSLSSLVPLVTGTGGALIVLLAGMGLFLTGKLHPDPEFQRIITENDRLREANDLLRKASEELRAQNATLADASNLTNNLVTALIGVAHERRAAENSQPPVVLQLPAPDPGVPGAGNVGA